MSDSRQRFAKHRRARRNDWRALLAPWVAVVVALAPLMGVLHRAFVPHYVCEHGDLIELGAEPAAVAGSEPGIVRSATVEQAANTKAHAHDHCPFASLSRTASAPRRDRPAIQAELLAVHSHRSIEQPERVRSILLLAPKTSPPATVVSA